ncbi:MAG: hypothetical protein L0Z73_19065 [Gammaproteobacteria bacterium]|nr:hypothetical protein [Gammaproteobacteria bacterium]
MLDPFESRLADMLSDGLAGMDNIVVRPRDDLADLLVADTDRVVIVVRLLTAASDNQLGDDARERLGQRGDYQLRASLFLTGEVAVDFIVAETPQDGDAELNRPLLLKVLDKALVVLHEENLRKGRAFQTGNDIGFDLTGFRLTGLGPVAEQKDNFRMLRATYHYAGRFWPVELLAEGNVIQTLPTRIAVLPVQIPQNIQANAGSEDVTIPLHVDLRSLNGAPVRLVARMKGASPPGQLVGDTTNVPPGGYVAYIPNAEGVFELVYRPPASLSNDTQVRISLGLAHTERATISLGELSIRVAS